MMDFGKVFRPLFLVGGFLLFFLSAGCGQGKVEDKAFDTMLQGLLDPSVPSISVDSLRELCSEKDVLLLDARSREEYEVSHMKNAVWVGYEGFDLKRVKEVSKERFVVVYCSVGKRSGEVAQQMREVGFQNTVNLYGGIFEWVNRGERVYRNDHPIDSVHAYSKAWGVWLKEGKKIYESGSKR